MGVSHFAVSSDKKPAITVAKLQYFCVFYILLPGLRIILAREMGGETFDTWVSGISKRFRDPLSIERVVQK